MIRPRSRFLGLALGTIATGLLVHRYGAPLGPAGRDLVGDALWGAMIAWWVGVVSPATGLATRSLASYAICAAVEASQLLRWPILESIRETGIGHLVLGSDFDPRDLAAYAIGVAGAALLEIVLTHRGHPARHG